MSFEQSGFLQSDHSSILGRVRQRFAASKYRFQKPWETFKARPTTPRVPSRAARPGLPVAGNAREVSLMAGA